MEHSNKPCKVILLVYINEDFFFNEASFEINVTSLLAKSHIANCKNLADLKIWVNTEG